MDESTITVFFNNVYHTLDALNSKFISDPQSLTEFEQKLLNDLETVIVHSQYQEMIRQHFSTK